MEKPQISNFNKRAIWDCDSTLYDSFELNSFQNQLNSAITSSTRTLSMPRHLPSEQQQQQQQQFQYDEKKPLVKSKFSRTFQKLLKSVFRTHARPSHGSETSPGPWFMDQESGKGDEGKRYDGNVGCFHVFEKGDHGLSTIPEVPEFVPVSSEIGSFVRKTRSERFTAASVGIYCV